MQCWGMAVDGGKEVQAEGGRGDYSRHGEIIYVSCDEMWREDDRARGEFRIHLRCLFSLRNVKILIPTMNFWTADRTAKRAFCGPKKLIFDFQAGTHVGTHDRMLRHLPT
jgi:hypothetical protein